MSDVQRQVFVDNRAIKAAARAMAKTDIRYYLNGLNVQADGSRTTVVGTNGHFLIAVSQRMENTVTEPVSFILPSKVAGQLARAPARGVNQYALSQEPEGRWSMPLQQWGGGSSATFTPIEANYPDWLRVLPKEMSGEPAAFNPVYVKTVGEAAADLSRQAKCLGLWLRQNGHGAAVARVDIEAFEMLAVLMPLRDDRPPTLFPEWAAVAKTAEVPQ